MYCGSPQDIFIVLLGLCSWPSGRFVCDNQQLTTSLCGDARCSCRLLPRHHNFNTECQKPNSQSQSNLPASEPRPTNPINPSEGWKRPICGQSESCRLSLMYCTWRKGTTHGDNGVTGLCVFVHWALIHAFVGERAT